MKKLFIILCLIPLSAYSQDSDRKARTICDDLESAQEYVKKSMLNITKASEETRFIFSPPRLTPMRMLQLIKEGKTVKCFSRHTSRPSSHNKARLIKNLLVENWNPYTVSYDLMEVDYAAYKDEKVVIDFK